MCCTAYRVPYRVPRTVWCTTGNTNRLYCLSRAVTGDRYLVREFGTSSALRFDRDAENAVFAQLSERGLAPALVATFPGGPSPIPNQVALTVFTTVMAYAVRTS